MKQKLSIHFEETKTQSEGTKFGGQPNWLTEPEWPYSESWDRPMQFLCQIKLPDFISCETKYAYIFVTHQNHDERDNENWFFDPDACFAEDGENAIIIQPGGKALVPTKNQKTGPTIYHDNGQSCEFKVHLEQQSEPIYTLEKYQKLTTQEQTDYFTTIQGNKIGGTPAFFQGDEWPSGGPKEWSFLLQMDQSNIPFYFNLGASPICFTFISKDCTEGRFFCQD